MTSTRLEAFSDGVIAIILTIMVLELKAPHEPGFASLRVALPGLLSYVLSFVIVAIYWVNHHHLVHLARSVDRGILWANLHLLFWLSLVPWVTACLGEHPAAPFAVALYATIAAACSGAFLLLRRRIAARNQHDPRLGDLHRRMSRKNLVALALYVAAIPLAWVAIPLALALIAGPAVMYFLPDRRVEALGGTA